MHDQLRSDLSSPPSGSTNYGSPDLAIGGAVSPPTYNGDKLPDGDLAVVLSGEAPDLRERLVEMRAGLIEGLTTAPHIDGGYLRLLGDVCAALAAVDAARAPKGVTTIVIPLAERAIVADDGRSIHLTMYRGAETLAGASLTPLRALQLGHELIAAGMSRAAVRAWAER